MPENLRSASFPDKTLDNRSLWLTHLSPTSEGKQNYALKVLVDSSMHYV